MRIQGNSDNDDNDDKHDKSTKGESILIGFLGPNSDVLDDEGLNHVDIDDFLQQRGRGELDEGGLGIDDQVALSIVQVTADISRVQLYERGLSMVQVNLGLTLHELFPMVSLRNPFPVGLANSNAQIHYIS